MKSVCPSLSSWPVSEPVQCSIQTLVTYFIVVRLVLINRISLQHCRPVDYVQEPNEALASSRRKLLGETGMSSYCGLLIGSPRLEPLSAASRALWPGGSAFAAQGSGLWAPPRPGALGGVPVIPRKIIWSGPMLYASSPEIPRGGHGILPSWCHWCALEVGSSGS
jgi:hypothetical protein